MPRKEPELRREDVFLDLVGHIYDAALDSALWPSVLKQVRKTIGGTNMVFQGGPKNPMACTFVYSDGVPDEGPREYMEYYSAIDPRFAHFMRNPRTPIHHDYLHIDEKGIGRSEYYAWLAGQGLKYYIASPVLNEDNTLAILSLQRSPQQGHVQTRDIDVFSKLIPHFTRAVQISQRFNDLDLQRAATLEALDHMPFGVILVDSRGKILALNRTAGEVVEQCDGLSITRSGLAAATAQATSELRSLIARSAQTMAGESLSPGGQLALARPSMKRPLSVLVAPLHLREVEWSKRTPTVAVFVSDPERTAKAPAETISRLYGLTPAEARLVVQLIGGRSVAEAADELRITSATARNQLKAVFRKTETHRQSDLVRLVLTGVAQLAEET